MWVSLTVRRGHLQYFGSFSEFLDISSVPGFPWWFRGKESICRQRTCVLSLYQEDSLEKEMAIHSSILAWRIPWKEELGRLLSMGLQKSQIRLSN